MEARRLPLGHFIVYGDWDGGWRIRGSGSAFGRLVIIQRWLRKQAPSISAVDPVSARTAERAVRRLDKLRARDGAQRFHGGIVQRFH